MGASGWCEYIEFADDLPALLYKVELRELAEQDYYWNEGWAEVGRERPSTLRELRQLFNDEDYEEFAADGTHSILDVYQVLNAGSPDEFGTIIALSNAEVAAFGTATPTRAQFESAYDDWRNPIAEFPRWSGRCTTIYDDGRPTEVVFWGESGD